MIGASITGNPSGPNPPIEPHVKVLVTLYWLGQMPGSYRAVGERFGLGGATVLKIVGDVCTAIIELLGVWIEFDFSDPAQLSAVMEGFRHTKDMPNCAGAIDGTHFRMEAPFGGPRRADYFNRKGHFSIAMQAVVNSVGRILNIVTGLPGSVHDARILKESDLFMSADRRQILHSPTEAIQGEVLRPYILGDAGYPLLSWLITPFSGPTSSLSVQQRLFNYKQSSARMAVECAFGILKSRFKFLRYIVTVKDPARITDMISACCILHNICLHGGDESPEPPFQEADLEPFLQQGAVEPSAVAVAARNALAAHFAAEF